MIESFERAMEKMDAQVRVLLNEWNEKEDGPDEVVALARYCTAAMFAEILEEAFDEVSKAVVNKRHAIDTLVAAC